MKIQFAHTDDEMIIEGIRLSNDKALNLLYKKYYSMIKNYVLTNNGTQDDAADVFQECVIIFYEKIKIGNFALTSTIKTYLFSMCKNNWLNKLRQMKKFV